MTDTALAADVQATVDTRVEQYIKLRDHIKKMDAEYEAKKKPYTETLNLINGWLTSFLDTAKAESMKTKHGTCYTTTRHTASLADADAFMKYVIDTNSFELLDRRANSTAVKDYVKQNNQLPPGCNLSAIRTVGVRKPKEKPPQEE